MRTAESDHPEGLTPQGGEVEVELAAEPVAELTVEPGVAAVELAGGGYR